MTKTKKVKNKIIKEDKLLIEEFRKNLSEIKYIKPETRERLLEIKETVNLNYQSNELLNLWKDMVGDSIAYLKGLDTREKHHDNMRLGVGRIFDYIKEYNSFERILYGAIENYRDHIIHVFRTFFLGDYLIRNSFGYKNVEPIEDINISESEKEAMWCIISLCHDLGYPLEVIHTLNDPIRRILKTFGPISVSEFGYGYFPHLTEISNFAIRFISSDIVKKELQNGKTISLIHLQPKYFQKFLSALCNYDHGIISGILLIKDLVYFKETDYAFDEYKYLVEEDVRQFMIRRNIIRPIASHNCGDIYYLKGTSFSFLLKAFDEMQEWGRPRLIDITKRGGTETELIINKFNNRIVDYTIIFKYPGEIYGLISDKEKEYSKDEVKGYFKTKCGEWMNVLRSAVGGADRDLILNFTVEDHTSVDKVIYSLSHINPSNFDIEPPEIKKEILETKII